MTDLPVFPDKKANHKDQGINNKKNGCNQNRIHQSERPLKPVNKILLPKASQPETPDERINLMQG